MASTAAEGKLIVALDNMSKERALELTRKLAHLRGLWGVKVNDLLREHGYSLIAELGELGVRVMADLKLHDIPNTVENDCKKLRAYSPDIVTVHCSGLRAMVRAAVDNIGPDSQIIGITVLTSIDDEQVSDFFAEGFRLSQVERFAEEGGRGGCAGFVCSGLEANSLRRYEWDGVEDWNQSGHSSVWRPRLVIPGIRKPTGEAGDQKAITTATDAIRNGADEIVVGRPITEAADPVEAAQSFIVEIESLTPLE